MDETEDFPISDEEFAAVTTTLKRFKLAELQEMINVLIPEISVNTIFKRLNKVKMRCNAKNFVDMVKFELQRLNREEIIRLNHSVLLFDKAYHTQKTVWSSIELLQKRDDRINDGSSIEKVSKTILQTIRISKMNAFVEVIKHVDGFYYILVKEKKISKQRLILKSPIFCKCNMKEPYLFVHPKSASIIMLQKIADSLGYDDFKHCSLDGKHVPSLLRILKNRNENKQVEEFNPVEFVRTAEGMDYCQNDERKKYAAKVFGEDDPISLEKLTVTTSVPFRGLRVLPEAEGFIFRSTLTLSAPSIADQIKDLADLGAIKSPFPSWITKVPNLGKNTFEISQKGS